jgi:glutaredoxin
MLNKPQQIVLGFFVIAIAVIAVLALIAFSQNNPEPVLNVSNTEIIFYYGITCPHCKIVEEWMANNSFANKVALTQKEVSLNTTNAQELIAVGKFCKIEKKYIGAVPLAYVNGTCYLGNVDIINFFKTKIGAQ